MREILLASGLAILGMAIPVAGPLHATEMCAQTVSCGTKNGHRKEYPTICAARKDHATGIMPKMRPGPCKATKIGR